MTGADFITLACFSELFERASRQPASGGFVLFFFFFFRAGGRLHRRRICIWTKRSLRKTINHQIRPRRFIFTRMWASLYNLFHILFGLRAKSGKPSRLPQGHPMYVNTRPAQFPVHHPGLKRHTERKIKRCTPATSQASSTPFFTKFLGDLEIV